MGKKTHEQYIEELATKNPTIESLEKYVDAKTKILHKCKICGHEWYAFPYNILHNNSKCPVCMHKCIGSPPEYKNSIWASEYKDYFSKYMTDEQMKAYMPNSLRKVELPCPQCNHSKKITPADLLHYGFGCLYCSDGISYPNKFARAFVEQLPVLNVQNEFSPEWCVINDGKCRYDVYFEYNGQCYILEMDGGIGHGNKNFDNSKDIVGKVRDNEKDKLALEHGIVVVRIDCKISEREYIRRSIVKSELSNLFDLSNIDWKRCDKQATSSNVCKAASLWNNGLSLKPISNILHVHTATIAKYLKRANKLGLCGYTHEESVKRGYEELSKISFGRILSDETREKIGKANKGKNAKDKSVNARKVIRLCDETIYSYLVGAANDNHIHYTTMIKYCKNHNGFMYYDEWLEMQDDEKKGNKDGKSN